MSPRSGLSLLETVLVLSLVGSMLLGMGLVSRTTSHAFESGSRAGALEERARRALDQIMQRLPTADRGTVSPTAAAPFYSSSIDFVPAEGFADGAIQWGQPERIEFQHTDHDPDDGEDNDGNGLVDDGVVVWIRDPGGANEQSSTLCSGVPELLEGEEPNGEDDNDNGLEDETGLSFDFSGSTVTVRLTLTSVDVEGTRFVRTVTRAVALRNQD